MRRLAALLVIAFLALGPLPARAADVSGVWVLDQPAWNRQLDGVITAMLARLPPQMLAQMKAQGLDPMQAFREAAGEGLDGTIEFLPSGKVRSVTRAEGTQEDGSWTLAGDTLRIEVPDAEGLEALVGEVEGDRLALKPILKNPDPGNAFMAEMVYPLVRRP